VGKWVPLLEAECLCHLEARKAVKLDFAGVSFVDRGGVAMMRALVARGVQVVGASVLVTTLLERSAVP
jgi:ABC-type transporter Mla MlaB component